MVRLMVLRQGESFLLKWTHLMTATEASQWQEMVPILTYTLRPLGYFGVLIHVVKFTVQCLGILAESR